MPSLTMMASTVSENRLRGTLTHRHRQTDLGSSTLKMSKSFMTLKTKMTKGDWMTDLGRKKLLFLVEILCGSRRGRGGEGRGVISEQGDYDRASLFLADLHVWALFHYRPPVYSWLGVHPDDNPMSVHEVLKNGKL